VKQRRNRVKEFYKDHPFVSWIAIDIALLWALGSMAIYIIEQIIYRSIK
jgi:hypothetical protein